MSLLSACTQPTVAPTIQPKIEFIEVSSDLYPNIKLRRLLVPNSKAKGTVLFLHGFPETLYVWKDIAISLGKDYEVHAFDWPGYGQSSRLPADKFPYAPKDYAQVLKGYLTKSGIDSSKLVIYATDIGSLPALLLALDNPKLARKIIVGDFAPFNRPQYMYESLQNLKSKPSSDQTRAYMNKNRDEILENFYRRGFAKENQFEISQELKSDMAAGWNQNGISSADAFYYYYSNFTRDQDYFEANFKKLKTPIKIIWGEKDIYIKKEMGGELAQKLGIPMDVLPGLGHYPHLQNPKTVNDEINSAFKD